MEQEKCFRCDRAREEVKLLDALSDNELVKVCEECALIENIPVIRKPSSEQLEKSEKTLGVRERMRRMAGMQEENKQDEVKKIMEKLTKTPAIDSLRTKDYKSILDEKFSLARKRNQPLNLVDNFNWLIMMARKQKKIDRKQLADAISEPEIAIKMIENKEMPDDASRITAKIEQYLGLKLKKQDEDEAKVQSFMKLRNSSQNFGISEPRKSEHERGFSRKLSAGKPEIQKEDKEEVRQPARILKFDPETARKLTIADLQRIKEAREKLESESAENEEILGKEVEFEED